MKKLIAKLVLFILGWKVEATKELLMCKKYVLLSGPHTSIWDFIIGKAVYLSLGIESKFLIKKAFFKGLLGPWLKKMGAYPVDEEDKRNLIELVNTIKESNEFVLAITPEGTRKRTTDWKPGIYRIAVKTNIPIFVGTLNYRTKICRIGDPFEITGSFKKDIRQIKKYYKPEYAKHPENFAYHIHPA